MSAAPLPSVAVASLYQRYLVTRHTGRAVRLTIEQAVSERSGPSLTVIDFREVAVIDFSCADEVVARLVYDTLARTDAAARHYFVLDGIEEEHMDPVDCALCRRGLAVAARTATRDPVLLGHVDPAARRVWEALARHRRAPAGELAALERAGAEADEYLRWLIHLDERRLVRREESTGVFESLYSVLTRWDDDRGLAVEQA